ncbi:MAG: hypothetical protein HQL52_19345 [Magnetococcales bacterium]|nr:hypothetical protein [Magnetococcales bacterium]
MADDHRRRILEAMFRFWKEHGPHLAELGWSPERLFSGLDPARATTYDDMPALPLLVANGAELTHADIGRLEFKAQGSTLVWIKSGAWLGGMAAEDWIEKFEERAAIREYDGGFSREEAERLAVEDMSL